MKMGWIAALLFMTASVWAQQGAEDTRATGYCW